MNIEQLNNYQTLLEEYSLKLRENANAYYQARLTFANANNEVNKRLANLMLSDEWSKVKNYGIEKLIILTIRDALIKGDTNYIKLVDDWEVSKAKYKALDRVLEAIKSDIMAVQSLMKYQREGDTYGKVD
jgi:hypothetical protein